MNFLTGLAFFALSIVLQYVWIKCQRNIHLTQQQKWYGVKIDTEIKEKTPSMGGVIFLVLGVLAGVINHKWDSLLFWSLPVLSGAIGFIDDWLKFRTHTSEGFSSMSKLKLQLLLCGVWVIAVFMSGRLGLWPGVWDMNGWLAVPLAFLMTAGTINAVNITDGLDGLAGGCFMISCGALLLLLPISELNGEVMTELFFMTAGFMFYNTRPAKTFMGDTGSHFLGGALAAMCVMNCRTLAVIPAGFMFILQKSVLDGSSAPSLPDEGPRRDCGNITLLAGSCRGKCDVVSALVDDMRDTGSHFLGGALAALCVMNCRTLAIIPAGFMFILEMLSSALQIFTIRKLQRKVFLNGSAAPSLPDEGTRRDCGYSVMLSLLLMMI